MSSQVAEVRLPARTRRHKVKAHGSASDGTATLARVRHESPTLRVSPHPSMEQATSMPPAPPLPTLFRSIGYVEKADGQLEAIIMQQDQVQVVHLGDRIADRYRVTSITHDIVGAIDESAPQVAMAKPEGAVKSDVSEVLIADATDRASMQRPSPFAARLEVSEASILSQTRVRSSATEEHSIASISSYEVSLKYLGYVKKYDGKVEVVMPDGDSVRLVPATPSAMIAQSIPRGTLSEATTAVVTAASPESKATITLASSTIGDPAVHSAMPAPREAFRQVAFRDSSVSAEAATPKQVLLSTEQAPSATETTKVNLVAPVMEKAGSIPAHRQYPFDIKSVWFMVNDDMKK